ncbi:MAG: succinoglycan biosynthesis transport protein ExoP [Gammaproteobacteria bacterium]|jgi:succinoglycan biosynthesis transport protein ExoP
MTFSEDRNLSPTGAHKDDVIDLRKYWTTVRRHKKSIFIITFISVILAALIVFSMQPVYQSTTTLLIETEDRKVVSIEEVYSGSQQSSEYLNTQYEVIRSKSLARKVINELDLLDHSYFLPEVDENGNEVSWRNSLLRHLPESISTWFNFELESQTHSSDLVTTEEFRTRVLLNEFSEMLSVSPIHKTQLVNISFEATDRALAAQMANNMAVAYIKSQLDARLEVTTQANSWLSERLATIRNKLKKAEAELQNYKEKEKLIEAGGVTGLIAKQLEGLDQDLIVAQTQLNSLEAARQQIKQVGSKNYQDYLSIPIVLTDQLVSQLIKNASDADQALGAISHRYGPKHPKIISAKATLQTATDALKKHVFSVINGLERQYQLARSAEDSAQKVLASTRQGLHNINRKEHQLGILEREVKANQHLYDLFLNRIKETTESMGVVQANARIVDPAVPGIKPVKPIKKLVILIAAFLGLGLGTTLAFLFEHLDNTIKSAQDIEERLEIAVLGVLPIIKPINKGLWRLVKSDLNSSFSEGIRTIRTGVVLSGLDKPHKIIMVTSSLPGEGKTITASNTAINLSEMHKVLLIDADLHKPSIGALFGLKPSENGLTEMLAQLAPPETCIHRWENSNLCILPTGVKPPSPLDVISSKAFRNTLIKLSERFDHIIIDTPPILPVSESRLIATMADGVIFVIKADSTPFPMINFGLSRLHQAEANILGGVLNHYNLKNHQQYGDYSYAGEYYTASYGKKI